MYRVGHPPTHVLPFGPLCLWRSLFLSTEWVTLTRRIRLYDDGELLAGHSTRVACPAGEGQETSKWVAGGRRRRSFGVIKFDLMVKCSGNFLKLSCSLKGHHPLTSAANSLRCHHRRSWRGQSWWSLYWLMLCSWALQTCHPQKKWLTAIEIL